MECPNCKADVLKTFKHCPECAIDLTKPTHELEAQQLRDENARLKAENETLRKEKENAPKESRTGIFS